MAHAPLRIAPGGAVTQDPWDVWAALEQSMLDCVAALGPRAQEVEAIALTTQRYTMIPCAADGTPLMDAIHWLDRREGDLSDSWLLRVVGWIPRMRTIFATCRGRVLRAVAPELVDQTRRFLPLSAWLGLQLTGSDADTPGSFPGMWPMVGKTGAWRDEPWMFDLLAVPKPWLPDLVPAGGVLGTLSEDVASRVGLDPGLPLVAVGGDKQAEILGSGAVVSDARVGAISLGTAASVTTLIPRFQQDLSARIYTTAAAEPDAWCLEYMLNRGMWMVTWLQREILQGVDLEVLEREAQNVPLGAEGITVIPRWGAPVATPHERGAILGFSEAHGRGHLYRAVIEGICMDLRRGLELLERESGRRLDDLRVGGGGARSDWVVQTLASVLNRPLRRGRTQELSALGAAVNAAVHAGWYPDHAAAAAAMTEGGQTTEPVPEDAALYRSLYKEHFLPRLRAAGRAHRP
jgi:sugar (pentulose or hexulose) kinase